MLDRSRNAVLIVLLAVAHAAQATGFFVNQQSVRALGRVNAGAVAAADDASTIFFNPAGLAYLWKDDATSKLDTRVSAGVQVVVPRSTLTDAGSTARTLGTGLQELPHSGSDFKDPTNATPVPNFYFARRLGGGGYAGFGISAPFGQAAKFSDSWFGRYDAIEASLKAMNLSAVGAYTVSPGVSVGGGIDAQYVRTKLVAAIPDPFAPGGPTIATDGRSVTEGTAWTGGFNLGMMVDLPQHTRLGLGYRSAMNHRVSGEVTSSGLSGPLAGANGTLGAHATLRLPAMWGIGLVHRADKLSVFAQYDWFGWSTFDEIVVSLEDGSRAVRQARYRDAWAASAGAEYALSARLSLRGGVRFDRTPTVDGFRDTTLPDADRKWFGLGASYLWTKASTIDVAFNHVAFRDAAIDVTRIFFEGLPIQGSARIRGKADSYVNSISINFSHSY
jgi:long-chain fatty acid transport protein